MLVKLGVVWLVFCVQWQEVGVARSWGDREKLGDEKQAATTRTR